MRTIKWVSDPNRLELKIKYFKNCPPYTILFAFLQPIKKDLNLWLYWLIYFVQNSNYIIHKCKRYSTISNKVNKNLLMVGLFPKLMLHCLYEQQCNTETLKQINDVDRFLCVVCICLDLFSSTLTPSANEGVCKKQVIPYFKTLF